MLVLPKNHLNYFIFECFKKDNRLLFFFKLPFSQHIMMENPIPENVIKDIVNLFVPKEELNYTTIKDIKNLFRLEKESKAFTERILRKIRNIFEYEQEENYYKPLRVSSFWSNNYIESKSNSDRNKTLPVEENLNRISPYLKDIINNLKKFDTWKIN